MEVAGTPGPAGTRRGTWKNRSDGYGRVTKLLHWTVATAIASQFAVGYLMDADDSGRGRGRGRGRGGESGRGRGRGRGGEYDVFGEDALFTLHVALGVTIIVLATLRLIWRMSTSLPDWAPGLSAFERGLAHWTERALYVLMFAIPISGLALVVTDDDDLVGFHIAAHLAFFAAIAFHVGLVLKHQLLDRDGLLRRMT